MPVTTERDSFHIQMPGSDAAASLQRSAHGSRTQTQHRGQCFPWCASDVVGYRASNIGLDQQRPFVLGQVRELCGRIQQLNYFGYVLY